MTHKNFKTIEKTVFGKGSFNQLAEIVEPKRSLNNKYFVYIVDNYFKGKELESRLQQKPEDTIYFIDVDPHEPTTEQIDQLRDEILAQKGLPAGLIGIGGGSIMDIAKALALMLCNEGPSQQYPGLNLIKKPGVYHLGVPTISGTGDRCSMPAVFTCP